MLCRNRYVGHLAAEGIQANQDNRPISYLVGLVETATEALWIVGLKLFRAFHKS